MQYENPLKKKSILSILKKKKENISNVSSR